MNRYTDTNVWNDPRSYDATADESECVEDMLGAVRYYEGLARKVVWQRRLNAFALAAAVFAAVYFSAQLVRWAL